MRLVTNTHYALRRAQRSIPGPAFVLVAVDHGLSMPAHVAAFH